MAKLINGDGNTAVYASEDSDLIASIVGNETVISKVGNQFGYNLADANTIEVADGVIITKEGRRIQLDANAVDIFDIPTGTQGNTNYYIIGYKLETDEDSHQTATTFVQLMDNGTDTIPEGTFRGGDDDVYVSLYRVTQAGLSISSVDLLLQKLDSVSEVKSALPDSAIFPSTASSSNKLITGGGLENLKIKTVSITFTSGNGSYNTGVTSANLVACAINTGVTSSVAVTNITNGVLTLYAGKQDGSGVSATLNITFIYAW